MTRQVPAPLLTVGDLVEVSEADYCYGTGTLRLQLTDPSAGLDHPGLEWIELTGVELRPDGRAARGGEPRTALVLVAALRARLTGDRR
ncbi:hypothetical protein [Micromonospora halophytica]|uniref:Uncharacterized protein n=1 Tax=Micromonospora halophytica TaxID=47864 RepID=A0A1C5JNP1_9ACTN|nr:hypothetical protein [Micromonospora halophytica]SCG71829.1 hypothetical protein GA0070560_14812 [Micromonospora halophytica]